MIAVTGATGALGSRVITNLLDRLPAASLVACMRKLQHSEALAKRGVEVRHADFDDPGSLETAFMGVDRLLIISASGIDHQRRVAQHRNAIEAAVRAKAGHVFYTSLIRSDPSLAYVMKAHAGTEQILKESGVAYTILQNGIYDEALDTYLGDYSQGEVLIPADGPIAWTSRIDLAAGIALLLRDGGHQGQTLRLTGPQPLTIEEAVDILAALTGQQIRVRIVSVEEYVEAQSKRGKPSEWARHWASTYLAAQRGELAVNDPFLHELLGRPLLRLEDVIRSNYNLETNR